ncbi:MAG: cadherin-like beta sandwich domain-containing protein [Spirochaetaceae bacterium]|jgi:hypothetical protein|nr:cadherin-like beta sandwich domain-containing protein [Spirochaetaceae bacterium]
MRKNKRNLSAALLSTGVFAALFCMALFGACRVQGEDGEAHPPSKSPNTGGLFMITIAPEAAGKVKASARFAPSIAEIYLEVADGLFAQSFAVAIENEQDVITPVLCPESEGGRQRFSFTMPAVNVTVNGTFSDTASADASLASISTAQVCADADQTNIDSFTPEQTDYIVEVDCGTQSVSLAFAANHIGARTELVNAQASENGAQAALNGDVTIVTLKVTAQDTTTVKEYAVKVIRLPDLSLEFIAADGGVFTGAAADIIASPGTEVSHTLPYDGTGTLNVTLTVRARNFNTQISGGAGDFSGIVGSAGTVQTQIQGFAIGESHKKSGLINVKKNVGGHDYFKAYMLTLIRPDDLLFPSEPMAVIDGLTPRYIRNSAASGDYDEMYVFKANAQNQNTAYTMHFNRSPTEAAKIFMVAGGAGGGRSGDGYPGGGGGAGGVIISTTEYFHAENYTVTAGRGGNGSTDFPVTDTNPERQGGNSTIAGTGVELTAYGGGAGGSDRSGKATYGNSGGSGGGGYTGGGGALNVTPAQGKNGGYSSGGGNGSGGGGGGYKGAGGNTAGGTGIARNDSALNALFANANADVIADIPAGFAGGGGSGKGSGNNGGGDAKTVGTPHTGGGGGGGLNTYGANGGSGIIIIRYKYTQPSR